MRSKKVDFFVYFMNLLYSNKMFIVMKKILTFQINSTQKTWNKIHQTKKCHFIKWPFPPLFWILEIFREISVQMELWRPKWQLPFESKIAFDCGCRRYQKSMEIHPEVTSIHEKQVKGMTIFIQMAPTFAQISLMTCETSAESKRGGLIDCQTGNKRVQVMMDSNWPRGCKYPTL